MVSGEEAAVATTLVKRLLIRRLPHIPVLAEASCVAQPALEAIAAGVARGDEVAAPDPAEAVRLLGERVIPAF